MTWQLGQLMSHDHGSAESKRISQPLKNGSLESEKRRLMHHTYQKLVLDWTLGRGEGSTLWWRQVSLSALKGWPPSHVHFLIGYRKRVVLTLSANGCQPDSSQVGMICTDVAFTRIKSRLKNSGLLLIIQPHAIKPIRQAKRLFRLINGTWRNTLALL